MRRLLVTAVSLLLAPAVFPGSAAAVALGCGAVVIQSASLDADIGPCSGNGLILGTDNITLDLNGHRVFGTPGSAAVGIFLNGRSGVAVKNGIVSGFEAGVAIQGGAGNSVTSMVVRDNVSRFALTNFASGIAVMNSSDNRIASSRIERNGPVAGIEIIGASSRTTVDHNLIANNDLMQLGLGSDNGIGLRAVGSSSPAFTLIQYNQIVANGLNGIFAGTNVSDSTIINNDVSGNGFKFNNDFEQEPGDGIRLYQRSRRNLVQGNRVIGNAYNGIQLDPSSPPPPFGPPIRNRIIGNVSLYNAQNTGTYVGYDMLEGNRFCADDTWIGNQFLTSGFTGADCVH